MILEEFRQVLSVEIVIQFEEEMKGFSEGGKGVLLEDTVNKLQYVKLKSM